MEIIYSAQAQADIRFWMKSGKKNIQTKITQLLHAIQSDPFEGIGKPEALKHELSGKWSRRINNEHRVIYEVSEDQSTLKIYSLKDTINKGIFPVKLKSDTFQYNEHFYKIRSGSNRRQMVQLLAFKEVFSL